MILESSFVSEDDEGNFLPGDFLQDGPAHKDLPFARVSRWTGALQDGDSRNRIAELRARAYVVAGGSGIAGAAGDTATDEYDTHGENQVTGALRDPVQGAGKSLGRDIDEIVDRLFEVLGEGQLNDSEHAVQAEVVADLNAIAVDGVQVLARPIDFLVYNATRKRYYHPHFTLSGAGLGSGNVALQWTPPPLRFDTRRYVLRRSASGAGSAPATITDGTSCAITGGDLGTSSLLVAVPPGTYWFSLFAVYDETGSGTDERVSEKLTLQLITS